jgi:hypothetical protein
MYEFTAGQAAVMQACWGIYRLGNRFDTTVIELTLGVPSAPISLVSREYQMYSLDVSSAEKDVTCPANGNEGESYSLCWGMAIYIKNL